ncbi:MAG: hypothetical protein FJ115_03440 [Deltaproteobacteria bacterium]|nr:hypothetical protein [Deltaproteobacteria bacterium]MBM4322591.1 hypothetical protein [Deltaproteobacteria bacterium]
MALTTFGAIMGFAAEMVGQSGNIYRNLVQQAKEHGLKETLQALSAEETKNHSLMEKTRRENVTEMILEPIAGFQKEDYEIDLKTEERMEDGDLVRIALALEEREKRFFSDASSKLPLPEAARIFRKIALRKQENITRLQNLGLNQTLKKSISA